MNFPYKFKGKVSSRFSQLMIDTMKFGWKLRKLPMNILCNEYRSNFPGACDRFDHILL